MSTSGGGLMCPSPARPCDDVGGLDTPPDVLISRQKCNCNSSSGNQFLKSGTEQKVPEKMTKGETTKEQIISIFGSPSETSFDDNGCEIWKYNLSDLSADAVTYIPIPIDKFFGESYSGSKKELVIIFNNDHAVKDYSIVAQMYGIVGKNGAILVK